MSLWPDSITLAGDAIPLADVVADITIHHGRAQVTDSPTATTCQIVIHGVDHDFTRAFQVGVDLVVTATDGVSSHPRFTGRVTDAKLDVDELTAIAVGRLSELGQYVIGEVDWPQEVWSARITRLFAEAGLSALLELDADPDFDPALAARLADPTTLSEALGEYSPMVGAAVTDRMDGRILVQAIGARSLAGATPLDPADVAYAPVWDQALPGANIVTVTYGAGLAFTISDPASVDLYGERPASIETTFVHAADAETRARERLARDAFPHWNVLEAPILRGLSLAIGQPVELSQLPPSSPFEPWTPIVEGWQDTISGDDWTMLLSLSDPLASALILPWAAAPAGMAWNEVDPATAWREALTIGDL